MAIALKQWKRKIRRMEIELDNTTLYMFSLLMFKQLYQIVKNMRKLIDNYEVWGLKVNVQKTKYLCFDGERSNIKLW